MSQTLEYPDFFQVSQQVQIIDIFVNSAFVRIVRTLDELSLRAAAVHVHHI